MLRNLTIILRVSDWLFKMEYIQQVQDRINTFKIDDIMLHSFTITLRGFAKLSKAVIFSSGVKGGLVETAPETTRNVAQFHSGDKPY